MLKPFHQMYQKHFKKKLFNKLIAMYSLIAVASLVTVSVFAYEFFARKDVSNALMEQQRTVDTINRYIDQKNDLAQAIVQQVYQDNMLIQDTVYLLNEGYEQYIRYRLDAYSSSNVFYVRKMQEFFMLQFWKDPDLQNINLISPTKQFAYMYTGDGAKGGLYDWSQDPQVNMQWKMDRFGQRVTSYMKQSKKEDNSADIQDMPVFRPSDRLVDIMGQEETKRLGQKGQQGQGPILVKENVIQSESEKLPLISVTNRVSSPESLLTAGHITIDFNANGIGRQIGYSLRGEQWLVLNQKGDVIYPSSQAQDAVKWANVDELSKLERNKPQSIELNGKSTYVTVSQTNKLGLYVIGALPEAAITNHLSGLKNTIGIVTTLCIFAVLMVTYLSVLHLSRRTQTIVMAMKKVQEGNLNVRLPVTREDELGLIAGSFNQMCEDLKQYINKVYKSELKQKHAELIALQAQIKPHFLYNTLEVIRMRAVSKGAHDVGEMIYSLAAMFRHMVKDKTIITVNEEIENCRRYLELTRIRYRDKLQFTIQMDERLGGYNTMKLSVQPLIENYLVHGIVLDRNDNHIRIEVDQDEGELIIRVADNGKGIEPERLQEIQRDLEQPNIQDHGSLGLKNVQERLRILYGEQYGLTIDSTLHVGTTATVRVPLQ
ncbi:sensor histidine kinase [Paenibacillus alvei]|uniref:sensor histidine kinase n=1 Tax=Paenibacillus alvei TaxID=44250 RepID=UPI0013D9628D|nr:sensor histidine kinase [Paenibacillus alvei]NEZ45245.1 HAMP domain-containing protein [Paenibacillus alvei]